MHFTCTGVNKVNVFNMWPSIIDFILMLLQRSRSQVKRRYSLSLLVKRIPKIRGIAVTAVLTLKSALADLVLVPKWFSSNDGTFIYQHFQQVDLCFHFIITIFSLIFSLLLILSHFFRSFVILRSARIWSFQCKQFRFRFLLLQFGVNFIQVIYIDGCISIIFAKCFLAFLIFMLASQLVSISKSISGAPKLAAGPIECAPADFWFDFLNFCVGPIISHDIVDVIILVEWLFFNIFLHFRVNFSI